jgi:hypothetical protein
VSFYYQDDSNCGDIYGHSICATTQYATPTTTTQPSYACALADSSQNLVSPQSTETYTVYEAYNSSGYYVFYIHATNAGLSWEVDPTTASSPALYITTPTLSGYVATGIQRFDPGNPNPNGTYQTSNIPYLYVSSLNIGN